MTTMSRPITLVVLAVVVTASSAQSQEIAGAYRFWVIDDEATLPDTVAVGRFALQAETWELGALPDSLVDRVTGACQPR